VTPEEARSEFPVLERFAYLNAGSLGPLSRATMAAMEERTRWDNERGRAGKDFYDGMLALRTRLREKLGSLIGAPAERMALTSSTTDGCNVVLAGLDLEPDDEVVTTNSEHPGLLLPLHLTGARVRVAEVTTRPAAEALEAILAEVTPQTRLLALSHVLWTTGQLMPVHDIKRETGLPILVDGAQSVGAIPVGVGELDFYTVSCQKWLCGPEPLGALYVREPELLRIAFASYFTQQSIERNGTFVPKEGALRFDTGWLPTPALAGLEAAIDGAPGWRFERAAAMAEHCRRALAERFEVVSEPGQGTLVSFVAPGDAAEDAVRLYDAGVVVRDLPGTGWLRASCGWWTNEDDIDRLVSALS
jgi:selenocysteine lyase/cysteine desulfurase